MGAIIPAIGLAAAPFTGGASALADVGMVASIAGAGLGAIGSLQSGKASSAAADFNSKVAANNAQIAQQNATWTAEEGEANAAKSEQKTRAGVGAIKAAQAANGVDVNSGSALDVRSSAASLGELDAITIRSNAARTAYGQQTQAASDTAQSNLDKSQASNSETAGEIGAGSSLLGGLGSAAGNFAKFQLQNSPFNSGNIGSAINAPTEQIMWNDG